MGAKQVISQSKLRVSARMRVLEMENNPLGNTRENFITERSPRAAGKGAGQSLRDRGGIGWRLCVTSSSGVSGVCRSPPPDPARWAPLSISGCRPLVAAASAESRTASAKRARLHGLGRGLPSRPPAAVDRLRAPGRARVPGQEVPRREVTGSCPLSAAGGSSCLGGADSAVCQAVAAACPDSPVGGGPHETAGRHSQCPGSSRGHAADGGSRRRWGRGTVSQIGAF